MANLYEIVRKNTVELSTLYYQQSKTDRAFIEHDERLGEDYVKLDTEDDHCLDAFNLKVLNHRICFHQHGTGWEEKCPSSLMLFNLSGTY